MQTLGKRGLKHFINLLGLSGLGMFSMNLQAALSIGQVLDVTDGGYYISTLTVTGMTFPNPNDFFFSPVVTQEWLYNSANQNLYFILHPGTYGQQNNFLNGFQFASWSTRAHILNRTFTPPSPSSATTYVIAPNGAHFMQNGMPGLPSNGCSSNNTWLACISAKKIITPGFVNHWYGIHDNIPLTGVHTYTTEGFSINGVFSFGGVSANISLKRIIAFKTLHLRTENTVNFGVIPQTGTATATDWVTHTIKPTSDNFNINNFPVGIAKFQMAEISTAACGKPEIALDRGFGAVLTDAIWYDLSNLNTSLGIRWISPGNCNVGTVTATKQFTVQYN